MLTALWRGYHRLAKLSRAAIYLPTGINRRPLRGKPLTILLRRRFLLIKAGKHQSEQQILSRSPHTRRRRKGANNEQQRSHLCTFQFVGTKRTVNRKPNSHLPRVCRKARLQYSKYLFGQGTDGNERQPPVLSAYD